MRGLALVSVEAAQQGVATQRRALASDLRPCGLRLSARGSEVQRSGSTELGMPTEGTESHHQVAHGIRSHRPC